jgi:molybdenum cofactor cytidylyltransferase
MGHSLAAGIRSIGNQWRYVCIGLADMPFVRAESLIALRSTYLAGPADGIVQPVFDDRPGHPVIFGERYFQEMARLSGDAGARAVIRSHSARLEKVPVDDPGVVQDIDLPPSSD